MNKIKLWISHTRGYGTGHQMPSVINPQYTFLAINYQRSFGRYSNWFLWRRILDRSTNAVYFSRNKVTSRWLRCCCYDHVTCCTNDLKIKINKLTIFKALQRSNEVAAVLNKTNVCTNNYKSL